MPGLWRLFSGVFFGVSIGLVFRHFYFTRQARVEQENEQNDTENEQIIEKLPKSENVEELKSEESLAQENKNNNNQEFDVEEKEQTEYPQMPIINNFNDIDFKPNSSIYIIDFGSETLRAGPPSKKPIYDEPNVVGIKDNRTLDLLYFLSNFNVNL